MSQQSMSQLSLDILDLNRRIPIAANQRKKDAALLLETQLTNNTPIDTGSAISNWVVTGDAPFDGLIDPHVPNSLVPPDPAKREFVEGNATLAIEEAKLTIDIVPPGQTLWITNNDPAVYATNTGKTAVYGYNPGPGYVEASITATVDIMKRAKLEP